MMEMMVMMVMTRCAAHPGGRDPTEAEHIAVKFFGKKISNPVTGNTTFHIYTLRKM